MIEYTVKVYGDRQTWWLNGKLHREDGPALINGDRQSWWVNGELHREDGPAYVNGDYQEWYLNGLEVTEAEHAKRTRKQPSSKQELLDKITLVGDLVGEIYQLAGTLTSKDAHK